MAQTGEATNIKGASKDYSQPEPHVLWDVEEFGKWSLWRAAIVEFVATLLFVYVGVGAVIGNGRTHPDGIGKLGISWAFGATIFVLVYCTAGISGGHINPAVTLGLLLGRKLSINRAFTYIVAQTLGAICGAGFVKAFQSTRYQVLGGGTNFVADGFTTGAGLGAEILGTFILVYVVYSATDAKLKARDSHVPLLAPLPIGFTVFVVHLVTLPISGSGINPARSFGAAVIWNHSKAWDDQWIYWVGPFIGASLAAIYHQHIIRVLPEKHFLLPTLSMSAIPKAIPKARPPCT
ncbi:hypothetical protein R1sor_013381 [Riccia sorocarpa]|uniref:Uncharacterized protein n=1 Tax=Riccia sorocarpa TaxID=122646 RepID=A0ABD3H993_9MARC